MASSIWKSAQDLMKHDERLFVIPGGYGSWKWEWQSMEVHESAESSTTSSTAAITPTSLGSRQSSQSAKTSLAPSPFARPFYEIIVGGIHSHPNSVRVGLVLSFQLSHHRRDFRSLRTPRTLMDVS